LEVAKYIDQLIEDVPGKILQDACAVRDGVIIDQRINDFQKRTAL